MATPGVKEVDGPTHDELHHRQWHDENAQYSSQLLCERQGCPSSVIVSTRPRHDAPPCRKLPRDELDTNDEGGTYNTRQQKNQVEKISHKGDPGCWCGRKIILLSTHVPSCPPALGWARELLLSLASHPASPDTGSDHTTAHRLPTRHSFRGLRAVGCVPPPPPFLFPCTMIIPPGYDTVRVWPLESECRLFLFRLRWLKIQLYTIELLHCTVNSRAYLCVFIRFIKSRVPRPGVESGPAPGRDCISSDTPTTCMHYSYYTPVGWLARTTIVR